MNLEAICTLTSSLYNKEQLKLKPVVRTSNSNETDRTYTNEHSYGSEARHKGPRLRPNEASGERQRPTRGIGTCLLNMNWDQQSTLLFIKEYEKRPILWKKDHMCYYNIGRKECAWKQLSVLLGHDVESLKKKMESLRGSRRREKNRILKNKKKGKRRKDVYKTIWFAWESMKFLEESEEFLNHSESGKVDDVVEAKTEPLVEGDEEKILQDMIGNSQLKKKKFPPTKKPIGNKKEDPRVQEAYEILKSTKIQKKDESGIFGEFIAEKLRKMNKQTCAMLQHKIHNLIFQTEIQEYNLGNSFENPNSSFYYSPPPPREEIRTEQRDTSDEGEDTSA